MKRISLFRLSLVAVAVSTTIAARAEQYDSTRIHQLDEVVVRSSAKETNRLEQIPSATSLITPLKISARHIESIKDITNFVPNLYIPDYGSKMTTPIYLRGVGTRSSGQAIGMYVDNIPYMDKSTLDFELMDIQRIEVLRGPQGTLYGRNAMGGIINIYTLSAFDYQGTRINIGAGNYGTYGMKISNYSKLSSKMALSLAGYYDRQGGYFTNEYTGKKVDGGLSAGGRFKLEWRPASRWSVNIASNFDFTDQGAFAYGLYDKETSVLNPVNYNDQGSYTRRMSNNSIRLEYAGDKVLFTSNTGYQYLNDNMWMDQDFTQQSIFTINQRQNQNSFNQEFAVKSKTDRPYQWSFGAFGFYNDLTTNGDVTFRKDGVTSILQPIFDKISEGNPKAPHMKILDQEIANPGTYKTPSQGLAIFHQSTINNLFTPGLSLTLGLRLDYEKQLLDYYTHLNMNLLVTMPANPPRPPISMKVPANDTLSGNTYQEFLQVLPKIALKYQCTEDIMAYVTVSKGYKAGGYNIQMFSEVIQNSLMQKFNPTSAGTGKTDISSTLAYRPETAWNYELGTRARIGIVQGELALFYMDIRDVQLTQFVAGGSGRILSNAGRGQSFGVEFSAAAQLSQHWNVDLNYGYNHATFTQYDDGKNDYAGKFIPYTPQHTFSFGASYTLLIPGRWINQLTFAANYSGCGKIYWTERNDLEQQFYGLLGGKISARSGAIRLELWGRNLLATDYGAFYFESFGNSFIQRGKPTSVGLNLSYSF